MKKSRPYSAVLCCYVMLCAEVAFAQWPVFDFKEVVPISKDIKNNADTVTKLKQQLNFKDLTLNVIGKEIGSIAAFNQIVSAGGVGNINDSIDTVKTNTNKGTQTTNQSTTTVSQKTTDTVNTQKDMTDDYVNQTQQIIGIQNNKLNSPNNRTNIHLVYEEEEEEEEAVYSDEMESIILLHKEIQEEQKQLATELVDTLETQLTILNQSANNNISALEQLDKSIQDMPKITKTDKEKLQKDIAEIIKKQRNVDEWAIRIVESVKENYIKENKSVFNDEINNYTKVVQAYMKGDADKAEVIAAGELLQKKATEVNVTPNTDTLAELNKAAKSVNEDIEKLTINVENILKSIENIS
ncbi:MAG: hypothetical protein NC218_06070 [Acetobacter sp.]|nr:hypothetical protein [Acetobacter sp.]